MSKALSTLASITVLLGGLATLYIATDAGTAWTSESARKLDIQKNPKLLPTVELIGSTVGRHSIDKYNKPVILIDFIYTQCPTVCIGLGLEFRQLQNDLLALGYKDHVQLLSISFDLINDQPEQLANYLKRFNADPSIWAATVFGSAAEKSQVLDELGVIVIPEKNVGFVHNTGIYMVHKGKVINVFELNQHHQLLEAIISYLG